ncbi:MULTISPECIES: alpha/beta fold hydrolase [Roseivirga]|uniref:alpha/beta fold hydrolase n=1 Tax=Roseivirga TaxID=290180 RepID=UPI000AFF60C4|nr:MULTISPECIES: alpha/beta fold hydrolase [Roseivirga]MBO6662829.1 alpha/beta fold hydrolase [Roseivirga sp.]MBO6759599.1 alpha/beta fold hydrolase [Roseivirga sp.]MBO6909793.1 alpha/beta fold hydrolase [Roseivirga sp.]WPZ10557.1 alpha/beta fold hydrolase [Roseivirga spongicola]
MAKILRSYSIILLLLLLGACKEKPLEVEEGYMIVNGSDVYYKTMGEGEPLLVIHGGPVLDHSYFLPHFERLAKDYQLIFYDQRACGKSSIEIDSATMNLAGFVDDIEQIRQKLGHEKLNVYGHSWGGLIAMKYAIAYDDKVDHLILSNSMAPSAVDWQKENLEAAKNINAADQRRLDVIVSTGLLRSANAVPYIKEMMLLSFKSQMFDARNINKLNLFIPEDFQQRSAVFGLLGPDLGTYDLYADLSKIKSPTLVLFGQSEAAVNLHAQKMTKALPNSRLEVIKNSGHFPFIENPTEFDKSVRSFLNQ